MASVEDIIKCSSCLLPLKPPILLCSNGHNTCNSCVTITKIKKCKICDGKISLKSRNYALEQLVALTIDDEQRSCRYKENGCKFVLPDTKMDNHEPECKFRQFLCEGRKFAHWPCMWYGKYTELEQHFRENHNRNCYEYKVDKMIVPIVLDKELLDVQIISFFNGTNFFWYKHKVDPKTKKIYWVIQFIGSEKLAQKYYYEFEIMNGLRKFKVIELCQNDVVSAENLFRDEKCVVLSYQAAKNFFNDNNELIIKYRIMTVKNNN